jgi:hypothetical protein
MGRERRGVAAGREGTESTDIDQGVERDIDADLEVQKDTNIGTDGRIVGWRGREVEVQRGDTGDIEAEARIGIGEDMARRIEEGVITFFEEVDHPSRQTKEEGGRETDVDSTMIFELSDGVLASNTHGFYDAIELNCNL